jgi:hypothetical protein
MDGSCSPLGAADLYVHLGADGGIFVASGEPPEETAWVTLDDLRARVGRVAADGRIWLSVPQESSLTAEPAEVVRRSAVPVIAAPPRPDTRRAEGATALMAAASVGAHRLVRDLVARRAPVDSSDEKGTTALIIAARAGETEIVDTLHGAGADLDATDAEGTTALMLAAWEGHTDTVGRLVALAADQRLERRRPGDPQGRSIDAYGFARDAGHPETAAALRPRSAAWTPDPQPVVFTAKHSRSFFMVPAAIPSLVTVLAIFSGTLADVAIGIAMTGFFALLMELMFREVRRARLDMPMQARSSWSLRSPRRRMA